MTELVERLRNWETVFPEDYYDKDGALFTKAADEIQDLTQALNEALNTLDYIAKGHTEGQAVFVAKWSAYEIRKDYNL